MLPESEDIPQQHDFQVEGSTFLLQHAVAFLLFEMGLGKSVTALRAVVRLMSRATVLVLCPPSVVSHWEDEIAFWTPELVGRVTFWPYSLCSVRQEAPWHTQDFDVVIIDELQALKSPASKRTKSVYGTKHLHGNNPKRGVQDAAGHVWLLSGTPTPNGPHELYSHIRALCPELLLKHGGQPLSYVQFMRRVCYVQESHYGPRVVGVRKDAVAELRTQLAPYVFSRRKKDVAAQLPPLVMQHIRVPLKRHRDALPDDIEARLRAALDTDAVIDAHEQMHLATVRREHGMAKAPGIARLLLEEFENDVLDKVVIFALHRDVMGKLFDLLSTSRHAGEVHQIHGGVSMAHRSYLVERFREESGMKVLICQIQASGVGLNMEVCSNVIMAEASWSPGENLQAIARCHRITSTRPVTARFIGIADSIDDAVMRTLARKTSHIASTWGDATTAA